MAQSDGSRTRKKNKERYTAANGRSGRSREPSKTTGNRTNSDHAYQPVGSRGVIPGARLQKPAEEEEKKRKRTHHLSTRTSRDVAEQENYIIHDDFENADGAQLFMGKDTR